MRQIFISIGFLISITQFCAAGTLSKIEIAQQIVGKSISFLTITGGAGDVEYSRNGFSHIFFADYEPEHDEGSWQFKSNRICVVWNRISSGRERCFLLINVGDNIYKSNDGTVLTVKQ